MKVTLSSAIASFGTKAKEKLSNPSATGQPEDQLRAPFEQLLAELAEIVNLSKANVTPVGESSLSDLKTRPDYAVTVNNALVGFVELKAPGQGADPRKYKEVRTTKRNGKNFVPSQILSTPMGTRSASGRMANCSIRSFL